MVLPIRRKNISGRYYNIVLNNDKKIISRRLWKKDFKIQDATIKFKVDGTLKKGVKVYASYNKFKDRTIYENETKFTPKGFTNQRKLTGKQFYRSKTVIDGQTIFASGKSLKDLRLNTARRVHQELSGGYDSDEGERLLDLANPQEQPNYFKVKFTKRR